MLRHRLRIAWTVFFAVLTVAMCQVSAAEEIALPDAFSTSPQDGFQRVYTGHFVNRDIVKSDYAEDYQPIERYRIAGGSNAFLVDATSLKDCMNASRYVFFSEKLIDKPATANVANPNRGSHWLVVYLGAGHSSPVKWVVESIKLDGNKVRMTYRTPKTNFISADVHKYLYWAPLGTLKNGVYNLELYDADLEVVTFMRRVEVSDKP